MSSPYLVSSAKGSKQDRNSGIEVIGASELKEIVQLAASLNTPTAIHAIGDKAVDNTIEAFSVLSEERNRYLGNRLEHCQYLRDYHLHKIARLGLSVTTLASHLPYDLKPSLNLLGKERTKWLHRIRDIKKAQIAFALTTDAPVTQPVPIAGMYWACEGRKKLYKEQGIKDHQSLTPLAALKAVTSTPAAMLYGKGLWGEIASGMAADLVLLSDNPLTTDNVLNLKVLFTLFGGKTVYKNKIW